MPDPAKTESRGSSTVMTVAIVAISMAVVVTAFGWFVAGTGSPINHGVAPNVQDQPSLTIWVVVNFPAALLFVNVFSKLGSEAAYFLCVFLQWLIIGVPFGLSVVSWSKMRKLNEHQSA